MVIEALCPKLQLGSLKSSDSFNVMIKNVGLQPT